MRGGSLSKYSVRSEDIVPNINGPLYYERMGRTGPVMAFVHPNPMDQSCWIYQMARFSTWFRCVAIDIPGYGRSPAGTAEMSRFDMAQALWEAPSLSNGCYLLLVGYYAFCFLQLIRAFFRPWGLLGPRRRTGWRTRR